MKMQVSAISKQRAWITFLAFGTISLPPSCTARPSSSLLGSMTAKNGDGTVSNRQMKLLRLFDPTVLFICMYGGPLSIG